MLDAARRALEDGRAREAIEALEQTVQRGGDRAEVRALLGIAYARMRQADQAFRHLERAIELDPTAFAPRCALGELCLRLGIVVDAREHLARARSMAASREERAYVRRLEREHADESGWGPFFAWDRVPPRGPE